MIQHLIGLDEDLSNANSRQRAVYDNIARGPRKNVPAPFLAMLDAPELAEAIQAVGLQIRYNGCPSESDRELAILATAGVLKCGYEWHHHAPIARKAGVPEPVIVATLSKQVPIEIDSASAILIRFCREVAVDRKTSGDQLNAVLSMFGRAAATELIAIAGYYGLLASFIFMGNHDQPLASDERD